MLVGGEAELVDLVAQRGARDAVDDGGAARAEAPGLDVPQRGLQLLLRVVAPRRAVPGAVEHAAFQPVTIADASDSEP